MKRTPTTRKARASTGHHKHLRKDGKRAANKGTRKVLKPEKPDLCSCGGVAEPLHTCPFAEEINGSSRLCSCCAGCQHECAMDI